MLITNENLNRGSIDSLLENSVYLDESVVLNTPMTVPVIQFNEGTNIIPFDYVDRLSEETGWDLESTLDKVKNVNGIDNNDTVVCMEEYYALLHPELLDYLDAIGESVVLKEINDNDCVSKFVDYCLESYINTDDEGYMDLIANPESLLEWNSEFDLDTSYEDKKKAWDADAKLKGNKWRAKVNMKNGKLLDFSDLFDPNIVDSEYTFRGQHVGAGEADPITNLKRKLTDAPKNVLAKAAARLREVYRKWLKKANEENASGKQGFFKKIARKIVQVIDWIMRKIEKGHSSVRERTGKLAMGAMILDKQQRHGFFKSGMMYGKHMKDMNADVAIDGDDGIHNIRHKSRSL